LAAGVEALRAATWRALRAELRDPVPELVADLADRLAYVCARVTEASLSTPPADAPGRGGGPLAEALSSVGDPSRGVPRADEPSRPEPGAPRYEGIRAFAPAAPAREGARAVDPLRDAAERAAAAAFQEREATELDADREAAGSPEAAERPLADRDEPLAPPPAGVQVVDLPAPPADLDPLTSLAEELAAAPPTGVAGTPSHDAMYAPAADAPTVTRLRRVDTTWEDVADAGPPWLAAISRRLERRVVDGRPFAIFVVEVDDLDRLLASQTGREVAIALETAERGLTAELAPADLVVRERLGRWWLTSPDRDPVAARDLGTRVAAAIARAQLGSAPLSVSIGVAVCPADGESLEALAGRADEGMFAARAAGVALA
jgi:GGDEF domain-containing protein